MYGLINKAIEDLISRQYGQEKWDQIRKNANLDIDVFVGNASYSDDITYRLVAAASEILNLPAEQILESFGTHWVLETARHGYGPLLESAGKTLPEFLENLPNFHARIMLIYPSLKPPMFGVTDKTSHSLVLSYESERTGLAPFVKGLLKGLGQLFGITVQISQVASREAGDPCDKFRLEWGERVKHGG